MRLKNKIHSFRGQLFMATSLFIMIPLLLFIVVFQSMKGTISKQYSEAARKSVVAIANNIDYTLKDVENLSNSILSNHEMMDTLKRGEKNQLEEQLYSYYISNFHIEGIYMITSSGYRYIGAEFVNGVKSFPKQALEDTSGDIIWFSTKQKKVKVLSGNDTKQYTSMGRKVIDVNSLEELGYMVIEVDESTLAESFGTLKEKESRIFVCDDEGNIITSSDNDHTPLDCENTSYFQKVVSDENADYVNYKEDSKNYVAIYASLNNGRWHIIQTIPKSVLYADINRIQMYVLVGLVLLLIVIFILLSFYSKKITQLIERMMYQMKKVEAGQLDVKVDSNANNELDDLSHSFNHMVRKVHQLMDEIVAVEHNKNEMELEVLHAQINPHFLYNTLNTIRWMAKIKGEDSISDALVALVKLLRVSISFGKNMIYLQEEIAYIENYLLIQRLRFNQLFEVSYDIQEQHQLIEIPKLILQPIVENSLIYGIDEAEEREELIRIHIFTRNAGEDVEIVIQDNGDGIDEEVLHNIFKEEKDINRFSKVGLNNVNQRIKVYLGQAYGLQIVSEKGMGTTVVIRVPNKIEEKEV